MVRTDRMLQYYESQEHMSKLWDILAVYCWLDPAIGYCQGEIQLVHGAHKRHIHFLIFDPSLQTGLICV